MLTARAASVRKLLSPPIPQASPKGPDRHVVGNELRYRTGAWEWSLVQGGRGLRSVWRRHPPLSELRTANTALKRGRTKSGRALVSWAHPSEHAEHSGPVEARLFQQSGHVLGLRLETNGTKGNSDVECCVVSKHKEG